MNYAFEPYMVRVDVFKPSGKWYDTVAINMNNYYNEPFTLEAVKCAMQKQYPAYLEDSICICLDPYHTNAHPVMIMPRGFIA